MFTKKKEAKMVQNALNKWCKSNFIKKIGNSRLERKTILRWEKCAKNYRAVRGK